MNNSFQLIVAFVVFLALSLMVSVSIGTGDYAFPIIIGMGETVTLNIETTATGLIGGALGVLVGVSLMTVRELGRQQKRHEAGQHPSREE